MITHNGCGWCHRSNPTTERFCAGCGHEAHVARMDCTCPACAARRAAIVNPALTFWRRGREPAR